MSGPGLVRLSHGNGFWEGNYHPWRVLRQTHSRFSRPWFTFRASARAMAPPSPMVLLENLQETDGGGLGPVVRAQGRLPLSRGGQCSSFSLSVFICSLQR